MKKIIIQFIALVVALLLAEYLVSGISINGWQTLLVASGLLTIVHIVIKPIVRIITLPLSIITFGLFALILNAIFFWFVAELISGFSVDGFVSAFWGALVVSVVNSILNITSRDD